MCDLAVAKQLGSNNDRFEDRFEVSGLREKMSIPPLNCGLLGFQRMDGRMALNGGGLVN